MEELSSLQLSEEDIKSLKETFYQQAMELIESLIQEVLSLEEKSDKGDSLKTIKRIFHTLKGDSASIGLKELSSLTHKAEDLLQAVEDGSIEVDGDLTDLLLKTADCINGAIELNLTGKDTPLVPVIAEKIGSFLKGRSIEQHAACSYDAPLVLGEYEKLLLAENRKQGKGIYFVRLHFSADCQMKSAGAMIISQHITGIGEVIKASPPLDDREIESAAIIELIIASSMNAEEVRKFCSIPGIVDEVTAEEFQEQGLAIAHKGALEAKGESARQDKLARSTTIRVESERMDQIMDLVGELVIGRSMIARLFSEFEERFPREEMLGRFAYVNSFIERSLSDLQRSVMKLRMVPIDRVFKRFPRVVRDLAKASNKDIKLMIHGQETEVDKGLVDMIGEPLIHILRNAIDHGIETMEEREALGKERQGTISLEAYHQGNDIIIEVKDDGRGIDVKKIKEKALEKGLISKGAMEKMDDKDAIDFIFLPGFSTAKVVSEVSGRGVGMDVVRSVVDGLRGSVRVKTEVGAGTTFMLRFPLTLAIIKALMFSACDRLFAIPLASVKEITRVFVKEVALINGKEVLRMREKVIPLVRLEEVLNLGSRSRKMDKLFVVIVSIEDKDIGIAVNKLVGEEELVIKSVTDQWVNTNIVGGASILGNGQVVLILNPLVLIKKAGERAVNDELLAATSGQ